MAQYYENHVHDDPDRFVHRPFWADDADTYRAIVSPIGVGPKGPEGPIGPQGIQGIQGEQGETGPQGDPFTFADLTADQIAQLRTDAATSIVLKKQMVYSGINRVIELPGSWSPYKDRCMLFVNANGLDLHEVDEDTDTSSQDDYPLCMFYYDRDNNRIYMNRGTNAGQEDGVIVTMLYGLQVAEEDFESLRGPQGERGQEGARGPAGSGSTILRVAPGSNVQCDVIKPGYAIWTNPGLRTLDPGWSLPVDIEVDESDFPDYINGSYVLGITGIRIPSIKGLILDGYYLHNQFGTDESKGFHMNVTNHLDNPILIPSGAEFEIDFTYLVPADDEGAMQLLDGE